MSPTRETVQSLRAWTEVLDNLLTFEQILAEPRADEVVRIVRKLEDSVKAAGRLPRNGADRSRAADALGLLLEEITETMDRLKAFGSPSPPGP